ncbi:MAG: superoxide dismutase [Ni], partial [Candidatus Marinimicrobia bacterium]|nr:superoxide dismutase [Ni] [Candidatus Neomarinimicrobiota bacterium]
MKLVNRAILLAFFITKGQLWAHCQVPCGIYDDALRIVQMREDFRTIQKAMDQIIHLKGKTSAQDMNQCIRWV